MNILDNFAHGLLVVLAALSHFTLGLLELVEGWMRELMHGAGMSLDVQTVVLIFILALVLILILAHTLAALSTGPLGGG
jgi:hypothetical protein